MNRSKLAKDVALIGIAAGLLLPGAAPRAQKNCTAVHFAPGHSSATLRGMALA